MSGHLPQVTRIADLEWSLSLWCMNASIFSSHVHLSVLGSCRLGTGDGSDFAAAPTVAEKTHIISSSPCRTPCALSVTSFRSAVWLCLLCSGGFLPSRDPVFSPEYFSPSQCKAQQPQEQRYPFRRCVEYCHASRQWWGCQSLGILTRAQVLMRAFAHWGCTDTVRESALDVDSGTEIPCCTWDSNPSKHCAGFSGRCSTRWTIPTPLCSTVRCSVCVCACADQHWHWGGGA